MAKITTFRAKEPIVCNFFFNLITFPVTTVQQRSCDCLGEHQMIIMLIGEICLTDPSGETTTTDVT